MRERELDIKMNNMWRTTLELQEVCKDMTAWPELLDGHT